MHDQDLIGSGGGDQVGVQIHVDQDVERQVAGAQHPQDSFARKEKVREGSESVLLPDFTKLNIFLKVKYL